MIHTPSDIGQKTFIRSLDTTIPRRELGTAPGGGAVDSASRFFPAPNLSRVVLLKRVTRREVGYLAIAA